MKVFDIETNGFLATMDKTHCIAVEDSETGEKMSAQDVTEGIQILKDADVVGGHNVLNFDLPALELTHGYKHTGKVFDTLVASRVIWPDLAVRDLAARKVDGSLIGSHGLKAWGQRLGEAKGLFGEQDNAWETFTPAMLEYCAQDVAVNIKLLKLIESKQYPEDVLEMEHRIHTLCKQQEDRGFPFDEEAAGRLAGKITARYSDIEQQLVEAFEPTIIELKTKTKVIPFQPSSRPQIADRLQKRGWVPQEFTPSGKPKVDEKVLAGIEGIPETALLLEYMMLGKRLGQIANGKQAWLKLSKEGKIHGRVNTMGAVTSRCTHTGPNLAQVPSVGAPFGVECRELFRAPEGYSIVGADASGLELRCLGHYMHRYDDGTYANEVVSGDIHTVNQQAAGLPTRNDAKTFIYAYLYGAGDGKIGSIIGGSDAEGKKLKAAFLRKTPALKMLREAIEDNLRGQKGHKSLRGLDGRRVPVRHLHASLNTLLQSAGAIICKMWYIQIEDDLRAAGLTEDQAHIGLFIHDEVQMVVKNGYEEQVGRICEEAIKQVEKDLSFKVPLAAEYKVGKDWSETH